VYCVLAKSTNSNFQLTLLFESRIGNFPKTYCYWLVGQKYNTRRWSTRFMNKRWLYFTTHFWAAMVTCHRKSNHFQINYQKLPSQKYSTTKNNEKLPNLVTLIPFPLFQSPIILQWFVERKLIRSLLLLVLAFLYINIQKLWVRCDWSIRGNGRCSSVHQTFVSEVWSNKETRLTRKWRDLPFMGNSQSGLLGSHFSKARSHFLGLIWIVTTHALFHLESI
jgi:hypothetical protein